MVDTEPFTSWLCCVPYPTTTSSSPFRVWRSRLILRTSRPLMGTSFVLKPMNEKMRVSDKLGTVNSYRPSASVVVPLLVPFKRILTPGSDSPLPTSITLPDYHFLLLFSSKPAFLSHYYIRSLCLF